MTEILTPSQLPVEGSLQPACDWRKALKTAIRSGRELCQALGLAASLGEAQAEQDFPVLVPHEFLSRMEAQNPRDPLLLQVLATRFELAPTGTTDPVGEVEATQMHGLLQKYSGRALIVSTGACAIHCRYCFRRHFPYQDDTLGKAAFEGWLNHIANDPSIEEVILSGGDPLSIVDSSWLEFVTRLNTISHVKRLRVHTRFPVVIPQRVDAAMLDWVARSEAAVFFVLHINHAQEIDAAVRQMLARLRSANITLLNQAVLLKDVNDSLASQESLCRTLINEQVLPYYLNQLDPVQGGMHFDVSDEVAHEIISGLRRVLPGYGVPQLVREVPGEAHKMPL